MAFQDALSGFGPAPPAHGARLRPSPWPLPHPRLSAHWLPPSFHRRGHPHLETIERFAQGHMPIRSELELEPRARPGCRLGLTALPGTGRTSLGPPGRVDLRHRPGPRRREMHLGALARPRFRNSCVPCAQSAGVDGESSRKEGPRRPGFVPRHLSAVERQTQPSFPET